MGRYVTVTTFVVAFLSASTVLAVNSRPVFAGVTLGIGSLIALVFVGFEHQRKG